MPERPSMPLAFFTGLLGVWLLGDVAALLLAAPDWALLAPIVAGPLTTALAALRVRRGKPAPGWATVSLFLLGWLVIYTIDGVIRFPGAPWFWLQTAVLLPAAVATVIVARGHGRVGYAETAAGLVAMVGLRRRQDG